MSNVLNTIKIDNTPGIKSVTVTNNDDMHIGGLDEPWSDIVAGGPAINVELEVDAGQLAIVKSALDKADKMKPDDKYTWKELGIMHAINECNGPDIRSRIDNYLTKKEKKAKGVQTERYKIKYR